MPYHEALLYIHILIALMLFALGIPALIVETSADDQIRHMLHKRLPYGLVTTLMIVTVAVILGLLLVSGPEDVHSATDTLATEEKAKQLENRAMTRQGATGVVAVDSPSHTVKGSRNAQIVDNAPTVKRSDKPTATNLAEQRARGGNSLRPTGIATRPVSGMLKRVVELTIDRVAKVMVAILVVAFSAVWWKMMKHDLRTWLVRVLGRRIVNSYEKSGDFDSDDVRDLIALGAHAAGGHEKGKVINTLREVCGALLGSSRYSGTELGALVYAVRVIYAAPARQGDDENLMESLETLRLIWRRLIVLDLCHESDARSTIDTLCWLGEYALQVGSNGAAQHTLDVMLENREVPFRIGRAALKQARFGVAVACLNQLEALAEGKQRMPKELVALRAWFDRAGPSAVRRSRLVGGRMDAAVIRAAAADYYELGDFETADVLEAYVGRMHAVDQAGSEHVSIAGVIAAAAASAFLAFGLSRTPSRRR